RAWASSRWRCWAAGEPPLKALSPPSPTPPRSPGFPPRAAAFSFKSRGSRTWPRPLALLPCRLPSPPLPCSCDDPPGERPMSSQTGERLSALRDAAAAHGTRHHPAVTAALAALGSLDPTGLDQAEQAIDAGLDEFDAV